MPCDFRYRKAFSMVVQIIRIPGVHETEAGRVRRSLVTFGAQVYGGIEDPSASVRLCAGEHSLVMWLSDDAGQCLWSNTLGVRLRFDLETVAGLGSDMAVGDATSFGVKLGRISLERLGDASSRGRFVVGQRVLVNVIDAGASEQSSVALSVPSLGAGLPLWVA